VGFAQGEEKMEENKSRLSINEPNVQKSSCAKCNAISSVREKIGSCFGTVDKIFAGHPSEEETAKDILKYCKVNGISPQELKEIALGYLHSELKDITLMKEPYESVLVFLKEKKFL